MGIGHDGRRSERYDQAAEFFRTDVTGLDMDMAFDKARCRIGAFGIDDGFPFIRAADAGNDAVRNNDISLSSGLCIYIYNMAIFNDKVSRFKAPGNGNTPF